MTDKEYERYKKADEIKNKIANYKKKIALIQDVKSNMMDGKRGTISMSIDGVFLSLQGNSAYTSINLMLTMLNSEVASLEREFAEL